MTCLVPGCKSNYSDKDEYVPVFSFPTDVETREKLFRAIPRQREDYEMNKRLEVLCHNVFSIFKVCVHHFHEEDIERTIQYFNGMEMIETVRKKVALKKCAVPSIFPNCPSYLTDAADKCKRLTLDDKEEERIQEAYQKSRADLKETEAKIIISTLHCIISKLHLIEFPNGWLVHRPNSTIILFLKIHNHNKISTVERSIIVDEKLSCKAFYKENSKIKLSCNSFNDIRLLENTIIT